MARLKKLRPEHALELKAFLGIQSEQQKQITSLVQSGKSVVAASRLLKRIGEVITDREVARLVVRQFLFIAEYVRNNDCTSEEALDDIVRALEKDDQWTGDDIKALSASLDWIKSIADSEAMYGSAKAMTLSFDTVNSLSDVRIITDMRPIFDRSRDAMLGATILNDLRIDYSDGYEQRSLSLALSLQDLKKIRSLVEDALSKTALAQRWLDAPASVPSFVRGEEKYGLD